MRDSITTLESWQCYIQAKILVFFTFFVLIRNSKSRVALNSCWRRLRKPLGPLSRAHNDGPNWGLRPKYSLTWAFGQASTSTSLSLSYLPAHFQKGKFRKSPIFLGLKLLKLNPISYKKSENQRIPFIKMSTPMEITLQNLQDSKQNEVAWASTPSPTSPPTSILFVDDKNRV